MAAFRGIWESRAQDSVYCSMQNKHQSRSNQIPIDFEKDEDVARKRLRRWLKPTVEAQIQGHQQKTFAFLLIGYIWLHLTGFQTTPNSK